MIVFGQKTKSLYLLNFLQKAKIRIGDGVGESYVEWSENSVNFCQRWRKSQSAHLPGHVEEQGSSMDKFIAWKSRSDTTTGWGNCSHSQNGSSLVQGQL